MFTVTQQCVFALWFDALYVSAYLVCHGLLLSETPPPNIFKLWEQNNKLSYQFTMLWIGRDENGRKEKKNLFSAFTVKWPIERPRSLYIEIWTTETNGQQHLFRSVYKKHFLNNDKIEK